MPVYLYVVIMFGGAILSVRDFNIVLVFSSFYINSFSFLFSFSSRFLSSSCSRFREQLPIHFRSRFSFVHENNRTVLVCCVVSFSLKPCTYCTSMRNYSTRVHIIILYYIYKCVYILGHRCNKRFLCLLFQKTFLRVFKIFIVFYFLAVNIFNPTNPAKLLHN